MSTTQGVVNGFITAQRVKFHTCRSKFISATERVKLKELLSTTPWRRMGREGIAPRILILGTTWRWLVSFTPRPPYPKGRSPWYPLD